MSNDLYLSVTMTGKSAARPAKPEPVSNAQFLFYYATDTGVLSLWDSAADTPAWKTVTTAPAVGPLQLYTTTAANLPAASASNKGSMAVVTDANSATIGGTVAGSGTNVVIVVSNGTNWIIGGVPAQA